MDEENEHGKIQNLNWSSQIKNFFLIGAGIVAATIGLKGFLLPNGFLDGGATGISLLINRLSGFDISILIMLVNLPLIYIGYRQVSKSFAVKTFVAVFATVIHFFEMRHLTGDKLLISVFGGFFSWRGNRSGDARRRD